MASFLLLECLEKIFLNLLDEIPTDILVNTSTKDLYSCTLVSRHWCRISTPFLYAYPFHHFDHLVYSRERFNSNYQSNYFKLIRTLITCIPESEIKQLNLPDFNEEFSSLNPTFNY